MGDLVAALPVLDTGATGLLVLVFLLVVLGRLIPKASHEREVGIWKQIAEERRDTNRELIDQLSQMLPVAETSARLLKSMPPPSQGDGGEEDG